MITPQTETPTARVFPDSGRSNRAPMQRAAAYHLPRKDRQRKKTWLAFKEAAVPARQRMKLRDEAIAALRNSYAAPQFLLAMAFIEILRQDYTNSRIHRELKAIFEDLRRRPQDSAFAVESAIRACEAESVSPHISSRLYYALEMCERHCSEKSRWRGAIEALSGEIGTDALTVDMTMKSILNN